MTSDWDKPRLPRPASQVLEDLLALAGEVIDKPYVAWGHKPSINEGLAEIREHIKRPCDSERFIDDITEWLAVSLRNIAESKQTDPRRADALRCAVFFCPIVAERCRASHAADLVVPTSDDVGRYR